LLFLQLLLSPLLFSRFTVDAFEFPKIVLLEWVVLLLTTLGLMALVGRLCAGSSGAIFRAGWEVLRDPVCIGVLLFLFAAVGATLHSISPHTSLYGANESYAGLTTVLAYTVLFFATRTLCVKPEEGRRLLVAPLLGVVATSIYALLQVFGWDPLAWENISSFDGFVRPFATLGHPNFLAGYLVTAFPLFFTARPAGHRHWLWALLLGLAGALALVIIVLCLSRGAWLALTCILVTLGAGGFRRFVRSGRVLALAPPSLAVVVVLGGLCWAMPTLRQTVAERVRHLSAPAGREHLWQASLRLFRDRPVLGWGLDAYGLAFPRQRTAAYAQSEWNVTPTKAHNEFLQILATEGLIGAAAVLVLMVGLLTAIVRAWRRSNSEDRWYLVALSAGTVGFAVQALFSFTVAGCGTLFVTYAALLSRCGAPLLSGQVIVPVSRRDFRGTPRACTRIRLAGWCLQGVVGLAALAVAIQCLLPKLRADLACSAGESQLSTAPTAALGELRRATTLNPDRALYWSKLAGGEKAVADSQLGEEHRRVLWRAAQAFQRAVDLVPVCAEYHANLGRILGELALEGCVPAGQAFSELDAALEADPANAFLLADAGRLALLLGEDARSRQYTLRGLELFPDFATFKAHLGYLALRQNQLPEASRWLTDAVTSSWHDDEQGLHDAVRALQMLQRSVSMASP
jgi:O-antigen ligase